MGAAAGRRCRRPGGRGGDRWSSSCRPAPAQRAERTKPLLSALCKRGARLRVALYPLAGAGAPGGRRWRQQSRGPGSPTSCSGGTWSGNTRQPSCLYPWPAAGMPCHADPATTSALAPSAARSLAGADGAAVRLLARPLLLLRVRERHELRHALAAGAVLAGRRLLPATAAGTLAAAQWPPCACARQPQPTQPPQPTPRLLHSYQSPIKRRRPPSSCPPVP